MSSDTSTIIKQELRTQVDEKFIRQLIKATQPQPTGIQKLLELLPTVFAATLIVGMLAHLRPGCRYDVRRNQLVKTLERRLGKLDVEGYFIVESILVGTHDRTNKDFNNLLKNLKKETR